MEEVESPRRRLRVSLLNLFLLTALIASSTVIYMQWSRLGPLEAEVRRLRDEVGEISVSDPGKLHAIQIETDVPREWVWRVWVPEGREYRLYAKSGGVPTTGHPEKAYLTDALQAVIIDPGEHVVRYRVFRENDQWVAVLHAPRTTARSSKPADRWPTLPDAASFSTGVTTTTTVSDPDAPLELIRFRVSPGAQSPDGLPEEVDGFMIWMEPVL